VKLDSQGLVTAICQDVATGKVLMVAHMSPESIARTLETGEMVFYSRSRQELWHKGETSGSYLHVESAQADCDGDVLLFQVRPDGPACHTGAETCFFTPLNAAPAYEHAENGPGILSELFQTIRQRQKELPKDSYTTDLFKAGTTRIAQKVGEEGVEVALAGATGDKDSLPGEIADLLYHTLVLLADADVAPEQVWDVLRKRRR
ncbi:MAG: bifunctional phosphoribosyl-AMP cyclohydrolase/phosphoribosyl-ATP diphosphatase HisIE, partial [Dehalococcoidia bacterium]